MTTRRSPATTRYDPAMHGDADKAKRQLVRAWRELTGGSEVRDADRPTLLAVSGGADSSALALALAGRPGVRAIGHVVHDLRPKAEAEDDRALVARLGEQLGLPVHVERVHVPPGNAEGKARTVRYEALKRLAVVTGCRYIASAHHADDVLETMLAHLIRGTGPRGLRGPAPRRRLGDGVSLVRPMLHITRAQSEAICGAHGWAWAHGQTNDAPGTADAQLRAALRARVLTVLEELRPGAASRASRAAEAIGHAMLVVEGAIDQAWAHGVTPNGATLAIERSVFEPLPSAVREGLMRRCVDHFGGTGHDKFSAHSIGSLGQWIDSGTGVREIAGLLFVHDGELVVVSRAASAPTM